MRKWTMDELGRKTVAEFQAADKFPLRVILDNIRSMHNVGSVFRTADAFLMEGIDLCGYTPRPPHRDIHKTALGATETVAWQGYDSTLAAVQQLKADGYEVWAIEQAEGSVGLQEFTARPRPARMAVIFGNEVTGVDPQVLPLCNGCIEIPQLGMKHSLNVSVAAGIVLWELVRTRIREGQE